MQTMGSNDQSCKRYLRKTGLPMRMAQDSDWRTPSGGYLVRLKKLIIHHNEKSAPEKSDADFSTLLFKSFSKFLEAV